METPTRRPDQRPNNQGLEEGKDEEFLVVEDLAHFLVLYFGQGG